MSKVFVAKPYLRKKRVKSTDFDNSFYTYKEPTGEKTHYNNKLKKLSGSLTNLSTYIDNKVSVNGLLMLKKSFSNVINNSISLMKLTSYLLSKKETYYFLVIVPVVINFLVQLPEIKKLGDSSEIKDKAIPITTVKENYFKESCIRYTQTTKLVQLADDPVPIKKEKIKASAITKGYHSFRAKSKESNINRKNAFNNSEIKPLKRKKQFKFNFKLIMKLLELRKKRKEANNANKLSGSSTKRDIIIRNILNIKPSKSLKATNKHMISNYTLALPQIEITRAKTLHQFHYKKYSGAYSKQNEPSASEMETFQKSLKDNDNQNITLSITNNLQLPEDSHLMHHKSYSAIRTSIEHSITMPLFIAKKQLEEVASASKEDNNSPIDYQKKKCGPIIKPLKSRQRYNSMNRVKSYADCKIIGPLV
jgi:hypothetical protein